MPCCSALSPPLELLHDVSLVHTNAVFSLGPHVVLPQAISVSRLCQLPYRLVSFELEVSGTHVYVSIKLFPTHVQILEEHSHYGFRAFVVWFLIKLAHSFLPGDLSCHDESGEGEPPYLAPRKAAILQIGSNWVDHTVNV